MRAASGGNCNGADCAKPCQATASASTSAFTGKPLPPNSAASLARRTTYGPELGSPMRYDARGTGVQAVLDELLDDGRGPFDHLARGDLVNELVG